MNLLVNETEMAYCDSCGNYVPVVEDEGSLVCGYEFAEYPELATVIGQSMSVVTVSIQSSKKESRLQNVSSTSSQPSRRFCHYGV